MDTKVAFQHRTAARVATVDLMGDLVHWHHPEVMHLGGGVFSTSLRLGPGAYVYKLRLPGGDWELDPDNPRTRSCDGARNNLLVVDGADEPLIHAPARPWLAFEGDGRLLVRAGLRRGAGESLGVAWDEGGGPREAAMAVVAEEDEHLLFEAAVPASARALEYLFVLPGGRLQGRSGGLGQAFRVPLASIRPEAPAWWASAVVYTILVDRFRRAGGRFLVDVAALPERLRAGGDLAGVVEAFDHLLELGVDTLHLTPIHTSRSAHRYDAVDPHAVDPALGGERALADLLGEAHRRGLRVLLDIPVTHVHRDFFAFRDVREKGRASPYWGWFHAHEHPFREGPNPGYRHYARGAWELPILAHAHPEVADHLVGTFERWARAGADGFRIDAAADIPLDLTRRITAAVRALRPDAAIFAEIIPDNVHRWTAGAVDAATDFPAQEALLDWLVRGRGAARAASVLARRRFSRTGPGWTTLAFTATHDQPRLLTRTGDPALTRLGHLLVLLRAAVPAILYGDEIGLRSDAPERDFEDVWPDRRAMPWDPAAWDRETLALFRAALRLRRERPALGRGDETFLDVPADPSVLICRRRRGSEIVDVILHAGPGATRVPLPPGAPSAGELLLGLGEATLDLANRAVRLGPFAAAVVARRAPAEVEAALGEIAAENRLRCGVAFREGLAASLSLPANLYLTVTEACNLRCRHCITHAPAQTRAGTVRQMAPWLLDALREAFEAADYFGFVHGGESLTAPIFPEVLRAIQRARRGRRYEAHLLSNGMLLDGERALRLVDLGLTSVGVSLDGATPAVNDAMREGGRLETVLANLREVLALRAARGLDLRVGISMVAGRAAVDEVPAMGRLARELGVDWLKLEEVYPATPAARHDLLAPRAPRLEAAMAALREELRGSRVVLVDHRDPPRGCGCEAEARPGPAAALHAQFRAADDFANRASFRPCRAAWEQACVDPDGTVRPVDYHHPPLGNLVDQPLFALWHGEAMRRLRAAALRRAPATLRTRCPRIP